MVRPRVDAGWSFIVAGALASSVAGHRVVEALGEGSVPFAGAYNAYRHVAVGPALVIAAVLAFIVLGAMLRERRELLSGRNDVLAREAIAVARMPLHRIVAVISALQFGLLYAMESVEHVLAFGTPTCGFDWLGGCIPVALAVHLSFASVAAIGIRRGCRDVAATCDRILAFVDALVAYWRPLLERKPSARFPRRRRRCTTTLCIARHHGLRAPPVLS